MDRDAFARRYPNLYHMAADGSWPSIRRHGLLSTRALVELYDPPPHIQDEILHKVRKTSYVLSGFGLPDAVVRDQRPLKFIEQCLLPDVTVQEFLDALNGRVFFWVDESRLERLLRAVAYRNLPQTVLTIDTAGFLADHEQVDLAPYNTGSVHVPNMPARGPATFTPLELYPYDTWVARRGLNDAVVELTVPDRAAHVAASTVRVERWMRGVPTSVLFDEH